MPLSRLPLFLSGMGSSLEIYPVPHVYPFQRHLPELNDAQRLASDWYRVGHALYSAIGVVTVERSGGEQEKSEDRR